MELIKNHNPRKGTETVVRGERCGRGAGVLKIIIPVRGRKLLTPVILNILLQKAIKNHNPRKGTETIIRKNEYILSDDLN